MTLALRGVLENAFGGFLCLRGFAPLGALAEHSKADYDNYQRQYDNQHREDLVKYLNNTEHRLFPELIFGVALGDDFKMSEEMYNQLHDVISSGKGFKQKMGDLTISVFAKKFKEFDYLRPNHITATIYGFESGNNAKIYRIDGNHRLEAITDKEIHQSAKKLLVPFCVVFFRDKSHYDENAPLIFNDINFRQLPIEEEKNLSLILLKKKENGQFLFPQETLENMGWHFVLARKALQSFDGDYFPKIKKSIEKERCCFFKTLFEWLLEKKVIQPNQNFVSLKPYFNKIEDTLSRKENDFGFAALGVLSFYSIQEQKKKETVKKNQLTKVNAFVNWLDHNQIHNINDINMQELSSIYDKIFNSIPKRVFLARWYPSNNDNDEKQKSENRLNGIKNVVESFGLELVDMGTRDTGTFSIRKEMFNELSQCDIFIADLTGCRHNVMVEVGYALHWINKGRMLFYFQETKEFTEPPFDLNDFSYDKITDSADFRTKIEPRLKNMLSSIAKGEI